MIEDGSVRGLFDGFVIGVRTCTEDKAPFRVVDALAESDGTLTSGCEKDGDDTTGMAARGCSKLANGGVG